MSFLMMLASGSGQVLKTRTFTQNEAWIAPITTNLLTSAVGKGANGTPSSSQEPFLLERTETTVSRNGVVQSVNNAYRTISPWYLSKPNDRCDTSSDSSGNTVRTCYYYLYSDGYISPTIGASASGFNKTFPGGAGGPATVTTFSNVIVTPGTPYNIIVPPGGSITINYLE